MIRAKVSAKSHSRDESLTFLYNKLDSSDWANWKRSGDISMAEKQDGMNRRCWVSTATMIRDEDLR